jgi:hypothetical protein
VTGADRGRDALAAHRRPRDVRTSADVHLRTGSRRRRRGVAASCSGARRRHSRGCCAVFR